MDSPAFRLNPALDAPALVAAWRERRRLRITEFLVREDAERLFLSLRGSSRWTLIVNHGEKLFRLGRAEFEALSDAQKATFVAAVHDGARHGFQYMFEQIEVPDSASARAADASELNRFAAFLSSDPALGFLREVTGDERITFADAQATAYSPGHFLAGHDDSVAGKHRVAAYVMNLTASWRLEWGGLLMFHTEDRHIEEAWQPSFNTLNLFAVPQPHSVSLVAPFAAHRRYSVTGWLRAITPPA